MYRKYCVSYFVFWVLVHWSPEDIPHKKYVEGDFSVHFMKFYVFSVPEPLKYIFDVSFVLDVYAYVVR